MYRVGKLLDLVPTRIKYVNFWTLVRTCSTMYACMYAYVRVCVRVWMWMWMYACIYESMYVNVWTLVRTCFV